MALHSRFSTPSVYTPGTPSPSPHSLHLAHKSISQRTHRLLLKPTAAASNFHLHQQSTTAQGIAKLLATSKSDTNVPRLSGPLGTEFASYMRLSIPKFASIKMPMGGALQQLTEDTFIFTVPRIQLWEIWLQPKARCLVRLTNDNQIEITSRDCELNGSHHVQQFQLHERFSLNLRIAFEWSDAAGKSAAPAKLSSHGNIQVEVDMPAPFKFLPKAAIESTGNAALSATLAVILNTFCSSLVKDYEAWAKSQGASAGSSAGQNALPPWVKPMEPIKMRKLVWLEKS